MNKIYSPFKFAATFALILIITFNVQAENHFTQNGALSFFTPSNFTKAPSPVTYILFTGNVNNQSVTLYWVTAQEINNNYFEIERSFIGKEFKTIGWALGGFENGSKKEYAFKDNSSLSESNEVIFYRLKQIDNNGNFSYGKVLVITKKQVTALQLQFSPNPFSESLKIKFLGTEDGTAEFIISNIAGNQVKIKNSHIVKGINNIQVDGLSTLPKGMYFIEVVVDGNVVGRQQIVN